MCEYLILYLFNNNNKYSSFIIIRHPMRDSNPRPPANLILCKRLALYQTELTGYRLYWIHFEIRALTTELQERKFLMGFEPMTTSLKGYFHQLLYESITYYTLNFSLSSFDIYYTNKIDLVFKFII